MGEKTGKRTRKEESSSSVRKSIDVQHLSRTFRGIARALQDTLNAPIFFIALHPHMWADEYYGVLSSNAENDNKRAQWLMGRIDKLSSTRADDWVALDSIAQELVSEVGKSDPHEILSGAFNVLSRQPVRMGSRRLYASAGRSGARPESAFFLRDGGTPAPGWFQDALDFGGNWELKIDDFRQFLDTSRDSRFCKFRWPFDTGRARLMEVQTYVKREGLMSGRLAIFIAEYLYYLAGMQILGHGEEQPNPSELDHFFLPLRGLGQWRASACWLRFNPVTRPKQLPEFPGAALPTALEELTTKSILESFGVRLEQAISTRRRLFVPDQFSFIEVTNPLADLALAFSTLWWSEEILLLEQDKCVFRLARDADGDLVSQDCTEPLGNLINRKKRLIQWEQTKDATLVQVNLEELSNHRAVLLKTTHGVSKVQFRVRLLTAPERDISWRETWNDYEAQLKDVLQRVLGVIDR